MKVVVARIGDGSVISSFPKQSYAGDDQRRLQEFLIKMR
jgi:hypothetical protein